MDEEEFLKAEQKRIVEYEKLGIQCKYGVYTWKGDNVNVILDDDGSISTWSTAVGPRLPSYLRTEKATLQPEKFWRRSLSRILRRPTKSKKSSLSAMFAKSEAEGGGLYGGISHSV